MPLTPSATARAFPLQRETRRFGTGVLATKACLPRLNASRLTLHGHAWREWPHRGAESPVMSSEAALSSSSVRSYRFVASSTPGDYLYRSSVFKWVVAQGAWGILRVH